MPKTKIAMLVAAALAATVAQAQTSGSTATTSTSTSTTTTTSSPTTTTSSSAATTATVPADKLASRYTSLAGSESNADAMVEGLRNGTSFKLTGKSTTSTGTTSTSSTSSTTINPPTGKMGYGNVNIALALAEASLKEQGITNPTPEQLKAALNGGTIKTASGEVKLSGVLQLRADGMGWGQIAQKLGFKVGDVVGKSAAARAERADMRDEGKLTKSERAEMRHDARAERTAAKVERAERPARVERVERVERPQRPDKPERPAR